MQLLKKKYLSLFQTFQKPGTNVQNSTGQSLWSYVLVLIGLGVLFLHCMGKIFARLLFNCFLFETILGTV
jgi:hypothetical protein